MATNKCPHSATRALKRAGWIKRGPEAGVPNLPPDTLVQYIMYMDTGVHHAHAPNGIRIDRLLWGQGRRSSIEWYRVVP